MSKDLQLDDYRYFLKDHVRLTIDFRQTDQSRGVPPPPFEKACGPDQHRIDLPRRNDWQTIQPVSLVSAIQARRSRRVFRNAPLSLEEIAFLLWSTQGIRSIVNPGTAMRTVPSAGARHPFETYLAVLNVDNLAAGIYRYLATAHQLVLERSIPDLGNQLINAAYGQLFIGRAAATFIWTAIPYRTEWRYHTAAHKVIAIDAGHVCQNLYLAVEAVNAGTCAIGAYHQEEMDDLLQVDGENEFTVYLAPVGKV